MRPTPRAPGAANVRRPGRLHCAPPPHISLQSTSRKPPWQSRGLDLCRTRGHRTGVLSMARRAAGERGRAAGEWCRCSGVPVTARQVAARAAVRDHCPGQACPTEPRYSALIWTRAPSITGKSSSSPSKARNRSVPPRTTASAPCCRQRSRPAAKRRLRCSSFARPATAIAT